MFRTLSWSPGTRVRIRLRAGFVVVTCPGEHARIDNQGSLHLPAAIRRALRIGAGQRVLLAAHLPSETLLVLPRPLIDELTAPLFTALTDKGPA
ncbi:AbrB/MazE/SpoVT family DNA-binding domain-containing protein [Nocardia vinacea]|uniref:AbrB/MazE/SpoVT family DNA-binding domain-containing protein n=1 Tax=Nocardia vinacea TaxID=96468 RepID=UPI002E0FE8A6|nr:AbrB/MazE/SpoVT family DNA-binding domain-containing protein [Nocardia vinacea]